MSTYYRVLDLTDAVGHPVALQQILNAQWEHEDYRLKEFVTNTDGQILGVFEQLPKYEVPEIPTFQPPQL